MSESALMSAILENPDDDVPRLVYADWLEETGGEVNLARAQFIRLEIEAETLPQGMERAELERMAARLFNRHCNQWYQQLPGIDDWYDTSFAYRRGFIDSVRTTFVRFIHADQRLLRSIPMQRLNLYDRKAAHMSNILRMYSARVALLPDLSKLRTLKLGPGVDLGFRGQMHINGFDTFFDYPTLTSLKELDLSGNQITNDLATRYEQHINSAEVYRGLEVLRLAENLLTDEAAAYMAASDHFDHLRELHLEENRFTDHGRLLLKSRFGDRVFL